ncbi:MAG: flagellin, partial [Xanthobacteraceae bacterium]
MNSILTNSAALSALQSLSMTQQDLQITQNQVSTGLAVQTAADNAAYWSIGQQLTSAASIVTSANTALQQSQAIMDTANSTISSVITTIDAIQAAITEASNPGSSLNDINSTLSSLSSQLNDAINSASFNGVNLLNNTQASMSFVSGYDASAAGGSVSTISFTAQALIGGQAAAATTNPVAPATTVVTDPNLIAQLDSFTTTTTEGAANTNGNQTATAVTVAGPGAITITSTDTAGDKTISTYSGYSSYTSPAVKTTATKTGAYSAANAGGAAVWTVSTQTTYDSVGGNTSSPTGLLIQNGTTDLQGNYNLTSLGTGGTQVSSANAEDMLT